MPEESRVGGTLRPYHVGSLWLACACIPGSVNGPRDVRAGAAVSPTCSGTNRRRPYHFPALPCRPEAHGFHSLPSP